MPRRRGSTRRSSSRSRTPPTRRRTRRSPGSSTSIPGKFIGFAKHDPVGEAGKIERLLTREVRELGLKGLKLHKTPTREVLDVVAALGIPILFHPPKVADFHMIASAYPKINFIMAHLGSFASQNWSEHLAAIDVARRYPNVYLETSCVVFCEYLELAARELPREADLRQRRAGLVTLGWNSTRSAC